MVKIKNTYLNNPFSLVFMVECWERFGFYTMQGLLTYFFVKQLGLSEAQSFQVFGAFSALVYGFVFLGGLIGDKILGIKRTMVIGAECLALGYILLAMSSHELTFIGLGFVCVGNGLFKANPSNLLSVYYKQYPHKNEHVGFTLYYMAINLGSLVALVVSPPIASHFGYHVSFLLAGIGLTVVLSVLYFNYPIISHLSNAAGRKNPNMFHLNIVIVGAVLLAIIAGVIIKHILLAKFLFWSMVVLLVLFYGSYYLKADKNYKISLKFVTLMFLQGIAFFALYQQMATSINFYAIKWVKHSLWGIPINPLSFQAFDPIWIVILSVPLAALYQKLHLKEIKQPSYFKFPIGLCFCAVGFALLCLSTFMFNNSHRISGWWIVWFYFFQTIGELLTSALGVAMVSDFINEELRGYFMGFWFLTSSIAGYLGSWIATFSTPSRAVLAHGHSIIPYRHTFGGLALTTAVIGLVFFIWTWYLHLRYKQELA